MTRSKLIHSRHATECLASIADAGLIADEHLDTTEAQQNAMERMIGVLQTAEARTLAQLAEQPELLAALVRAELAARGCGKDGSWVGFDKAKQIWKAGR